MDQISETLNRLTGTLAALNKRFDELEQNQAALLAMLEKNRQVATLQHSSIARHQAALVQAGLLVEVPGPAAAQC